MKTNKGDIACDTVVNCAGQWARQVGAMAGINVPLQPVKHQYIITEKIDGLASDAPTIRDPDRRTYFKEEVGGLVMGGYEPNPQAWTTGDVPDDWEFRLFDDDFDHFEQHMEQAIARIPALETAGVKQMINGPESFTPDGNFILGAAPECANMFVGAGFNAFGIASGGGAGWVLARVDDGRRGAARPLGRRHPPLLRTCTATGNGSATARSRPMASTTRSAFRTRSTISGRPRIVSPLYERLKKHRAVFGSKLGWERPNWFAPEGMEPKDVYSMGRQNWFEPVGDEHRHVREKVGIFDQSSFAKYEMTGRDAQKALDWICANDVSKPAGRLTYTQLLNTRGGIEADLTVARLAEDRFYIVTGTGFRTHDLAWIRITSATGSMRGWSTSPRGFGTLSLMGPRARDVLAAVTKADVSNAAFPFGHVREIEIAGATVRALRVTYVGELGWELHMPIGATGEVFDALMAAGKAHDIRPIGYRALESLRLEKGYRAWGSDITPNDTPFEAGLGWAVKLRKNTDFVGREALEQDQRRGADETLCRLHGRRSGRRAARPRDDPAQRRAGRLPDQRRLRLHGRARASATAMSATPTASATNSSPSGDYELVVAMERTRAAIHLEPLYDPKAERVKA